mgnify:CR=1 FL=1
MIESSSTVTHLYAQAILQAAQRQGITLSDDVVREVVPGQRVPLPVQDRLWDDYCSASDDPLAGLEIGLALQVGHLDSAGMLLISCDTLRDGLEALMEYAPVVGDGGEFSLLEEDGRLTLSYGPRYSVRVSQRVEAVMASLIRLTRWATGDVFQPERLSFAHAPLDRTARYEKRLGVPVEFGAETNRLTIGQDQGALPLIQANGELRDHLRQLADQTMASLGYQSLSRQVIQLVREHPGWGKDRLAAELGVSGRHLNRLLANEGFSFKFLRERELHQMALCRLQAGDTGAQVSDQLGFSEEAAFARAFRRWEGVGLSRFRGQHGRGGVAD